ncbi:type II toxin-antitoxin system PemK/MazF family toxin [Synechococcus sp. CS-1325]|uniref:type II toxin-antitoxin system PemK/MazF family toxin n=1 Tax=unclassified Synechococcus TaxID=2626047 RepID=UPI0021A8F9C5|nr:MULTISPECIES: type II toxin-antitoxin system PemK/MazF family toxin [unclassified Synechococcus]MCT0199563.1 type II toxin-antitoxin system PemK/MazF family toxin [Synechococcus sp. CS-1325]MCT0213639.1 type II toxin-antitoxin system PemK/MazF family toxin [Synechococcus sp. CS-1326]MCT0232982.1 type II toxin-antitoxin system PemK/MazF family toxin [Synechococcus sp. CS-1327]
MELKAGQIVTVDWRKDPDDPDQDPHPPEPNKLRPAVVVQDCELFDLAYPTVLVAPMTSDPELAIPDLTVVLQPSSANGCKKVSYLLPQNLTCVAKTRITTATDSCVTPAELQQLRQLVVLAIGGLT